MLIYTVTAANRMSSSMAVKTVACHHAGCENASSLSCSGRMLPPRYISVQLLLNITPVIMSTVHPIILMCVGLNSDILLALLKTAMFLLRSHSKITSLLISELSLKICCQAQWWQLCLCNKNLAAVLL